MYLNLSTDSTRLQPFCATRWSHRVNSLKTFLLRFDQINSTLGELSTDTDNKTSSSSTTFLYSINNFNFVLPLFVAIRIFQYTASLSLYLQNDDCDLVKATEQAINIVEMLKTKRETDIFFDSVYEDAESFATTHEIDVKMPRIAQRQTQRSNVPANTPKEYFRLNVYNPTMDYLITELTDRLCKSLPRLKAQYLVPSLSDRLTPVVWSELKDTFKSLLPDITTADAEYDLWKYSIENKLISGSTLQEAAKQSEQLYPNIHTMIKVLLTMPVSTATVERSFSSLRRLKTYMRSTMTNERLTGLALLHAHKDRKVDIETVIRTFDSTGHRRIATLL